ncbi:hypothetical protein ACVW16_007405 [Bradyrhizobium sp. USDA 4474]
MTIETPARGKPVTRVDDVAERAAIQQALLQVVGAVSNRGAYEGSVTGSGAQGEFTYEVANG